MWKLPILSISNSVLKLEHLFNDLIDKIKNRLQIVHGCLVQLWKD